MRSKRKRREKEDEEEEEDEGGGGVRGGGRGRGARAREGFDEQKSGTKGGEGEKDREMARETEEDLKCR